MKKRLLAWPALCRGGFSAVYGPSSPPPGASTLRPVLFRGGTGTGGVTTPFSPVLRGGGRLTGEVGPDLNPKESGKEGGLQRS